MLGGAWLFITIVLIVLAAILKQPSLLIIGVLFFFTSGIARIWSKYALQKVQYNRTLSAERVFWGENITLDISITNSKFLPLPWLHIEEEVPEALTFLKGKTLSSAKPGRLVLSSFLSVGWYHRLTRRYPVYCSRRGYYTFGPATINSGDPFGFFRNKVITEDQQHLLVYPRIVPLEEIGIPSRHPFGDLRIRKHLFEDPVQVMTTRDYVPGDPLKRIHWKSTARLQRLQTRVFEHTTTVDIALFLDTRTVLDKYYWGNMVSDLLETAIITATSIANYSITKGYKIGFFSNEFYWESDRPIRLPPSDHPDQLKAILEALAHIKGIPSQTIEKLLNKEGRSLAWEATIVLVTAAPTPEVVATLKHFKRAGRRVGLVLVGNNVAASGLEGITSYQVSEDVYRDNTGIIRLKQEGTGR
jgi:uncharacterized protein (DUF58 family)